MARLASLGVALAAAGPGAGAAGAEEAWPARPVRLIVPSSPGGGTDGFARQLAQALTDALKQQFIVDNRAGASGNVGAQAAATAAPDGYTFLVSANAAIAINPYLIRKPTFDVERDLVGVARGVLAINVLLANPAVGVGTLEEFLALARRTPGALAYGSAGVGSSPYLGVRMLEEMTGRRFLHVPYRGLGPALQDLLGGRVQFVYADLSTALPYVASGSLKALAVDRRTDLLPGVKTFAEAGLPKFAAPISFSVLAPRGTPPAIVDRMAAEVGKALAALAPRLEQQGLAPVRDTPAAFATDLREERAMWEAFIRRNDITVDQ